MVSRHRDVACNVSTNKKPKSELGNSDFGFLTSDLFLGVIFYQWLFPLYSALMSNPC